MYIHAGNRVAVLALTRDVPQGHRISSGDLAVVRISLSAGLSPVPASDLSRVVGRTAAVSLFPGTLLSLKELAVHNGLVTGQAVVGVATKAGQLPAGGVADGDTVDVVLTGSLGAFDSGASAGIAPTSPAVAAEQAQGSGVLAPNATVTGVATPTSSNPDTIVVSVLIPSSLAPLVANASAAGQIALVLVGASS
jgi:hypothetical protein